MRRPVILGMMGVLAVSCGVEVAWCSSMRIARAYQPFVLPDGIMIGAVSYIGYYGPGQEVEMTCWQNRIWHPGTRVGGSGVARQENKAWEAGLRVSLERDGFPNRGDTLVANIDTRGFSDGEANESVIMATIECVKASAGQYSQVKYLRLGISGVVDYVRLGGVFGLETSRCGPTKNQFP